MLGPNSEMQTLSTVEQELTWKQMPMILPHDEFPCAEETASPNVQIYEEVQYVWLILIKEKPYLHISRKQKKSNPAFLAQEI